MSMNSFEPQDGIVGFARRDAMSKSSLNTNNNNKYTLTCPARMTYYHLMTRTNKTGEQLRWLRSKF